ncbi:MAG: BMP family protein [Oscillospiraceae bacterium]|nr:BMP family protein [Oscillospiraceae bacterium]
MKKIKALSMLLALSLFLPLISCSNPSNQASSNSGTTPTTPLKSIALVIDSPVADGGFNANAWKGLELAKEKYGCKIAVSENVKQSDFESAFRDYANNGYTLILGNGSQYSDAAAAVAPDFPDVKFAVINGTHTAENLASLNFDNYTVCYMSGALAAYMTKTNAVGFIGGMDIFPVQDGRAGFQAGVASVNPNVKVYTAMADSFSDMAKGKELANSMITTNNVDILYSIGSAVDSGVMDGCKENGKYFIAQPSDRLDEAPGTVICSAILSTPDLIMILADQVATNTFKGEKFYGTIANGVHKMGRFGKEVPQDIQDKILQLQDDIKTGKLKIK